MKKKNYQKEIIKELIDLYKNRIRFIKLAKKIDKQQYGAISTFCDLDFIENAYKQEIRLLKEVKKYGKKAN